MENPTPSTHKSIGCKATLPSFRPSSRGTGLLLAAFVCISSAAQAPANSPQGPMIVNPMTGPAMAPTRATPRDPAIDAVRAAMLRSANIDRQRKMVEDASRLVLVANQLKASVDKTNQDVLSLDVLKQADEAERLAKSVKDKMRAQ